MHFFEPSGIAGSDGLVVALIFIGAAHWVRSLGFPKVAMCLLLPAILIVLGQFIGGILDIIRRR